MLMSQAEKNTIRLSKPYKYNNTYEKNYFSKITKERIVALIIKTLYHFLQ